MGHLILVCTISIISVIAFTYLTVTGVIGATTNTTAKVNATPNTTLHKNGVLRPSKDFLTPYYKGMAYLNEGNYTEAIPYFDKALAINPDYTLALNNKGAALYGLGIYNESIAYFDKALSANPGYTTALYNKGAALSKLGIYNESIAYFDKVLAIQPTNTLALAGKKLDLATFSKINIIAKPIGTIATPQNAQPSDFGYYFEKRATASSYLTNSSINGNSTSNSSLVSHLRTHIPAITSKQSALYTGHEAHAQANTTSSNAAAGGANMTQPLVSPKRSS